MPVTTYVSVGGGGGDELFPLVDSVVFTEGPVDEDHAVSDAMTDYTSSISTDTVTFAKDTPALRGAAILATLDGWWNSADYSGSGDFVNQGVGGSGLNLTITGPTFSAGVFSFDGVDDYMRILDASALDILKDESATWGLVMTPITAISGHYISKNVGEAATVGYALRSSTSALYAWFNDGIGAVGSLMGSTMVVSTKNLLAGVLNRKAAVRSLLSYRSAGGTMTVGPTAALASTQDRSADSAFNFVIGARADLTLFAKMDVNGIFFSKRALTAIDLAAIAAYYGV